MKKLLYILFFFLPVVISAQFNLYNDSPLEYAWKNVGNARFSGADAQWTSLAFSPSSGELYIAYEDLGTPSWGATVKKFDGTNWVGIGNEGFANASSQYLSFAISAYDSEPYVAYEDCGTDYNQASVMKFDGTNWIYIGNRGFSEGAVQYTSLAFSPSGEPFIAYKDFLIPGDTGESGYASVMKFDGTHWVYVGNESFSAKEAEWTSLAFSPSGQPYVAYTDGWYFGEATVMKFDGTNWVNVGNACFTTGGVQYTTLAFSPDGVPYVAYSDLGNWIKATVMKFDGTSWVYVGTAGFSAGKAYQESLAFSPSGQPYVAYMDDGNSLKATVMKFDGTSWVNVGMAGFSAGVAYDESLAFSPSGQPYVAYRDSANYLKATVMKYDSVFVGGNELRQAHISLYPNPAMDKITIETLAIPTKSQISIMNLNGQQLITRQITQPKTQIDISNLSGGVYFVRLINEKTVEVGKVVKK